VKVITRSAIALVAATAMSVGVTTASHGLRTPRVPGVPRIHIHIPRIPPGSSTTGGQSNCGNGANGSNGGNGANGLTNVRKNHGGKGAPGAPGGNGGKGSPCR